MKSKKYYDVFNGDADGICALQQLRLVNPIDAQLVTGLKRDIALLSQCSFEENTQITVLDVSLDKNRDALKGALKNGVEIFYADHHYSGEIPKHKNLDVHINLSSNTCTALIINRFLKGAFPLWAIVGAFGDNQDEAAISLATQLRLTTDKQKRLKKLGVCLNYNGYGFTLDDLVYHPAELYKKIQPFQSPFDFIEQDESFAVLQKAYEEDMMQAQKVYPYQESKQGRIYCLENKKWARRVSGVLGNDLARATTNKAHTVLVETEGGFRVSVRAPLDNKQGADVLCRQFKGGGRKAAAGINFLPTADLELFIAEFNKQFSQ